MVVCGYCRAVLFAPSQFGVLCTRCGSTFGWGIEPKEMPAWYFSDPTGPKPQDVVAPSVPS